MGGFNETGHGPDLTITLYMQKFETMRNTWNENTYMARHCGHHRCVTIDTDRANGTRIVCIDFLRQPTNEQNVAVADRKMRTIDHVRRSHAYRQRDPIGRSFHPDLQSTVRPTFKKSLLFSDRVAKSMYLIRVECDTVDGGADTQLSMRFGLGRSHIPDSHTMIFTT